MSMAGTVASGRQVPSLHSWISCRIDNSELEKILPKGFGPNPSDPCLKLQTATKAGEPSTQSFVKVDHTTAVVWKQIEKHSQ